MWWWHARTLAVSLNRRSPTRQAHIDVPFGRSRPIYHTFTRLRPCVGRANTRFPVSTGRSACRVIRSNINSACSRAGLEIDSLPGEPSDLPALDGGGSYDTPGLSPQGQGYGQYRKSPSEASSDDERRLCITNAGRSNLEGPRGSMLTGGVGSMLAATVLLLEPTARISSSRRPRGRDGWTPTRDG